MFLLFFNFYNRIFNKYLYRYKWMYELVCCSMRLEWDSNLIHLSIKDEDEYELLF